MKILLPITLLFLSVSVAAQQTQTTGGAQSGSSGVAGSGTTASGGIAGTSTVTSAAGSLTVGTIAAGTVAAGVVAGVVANATGDAEEIVPPPVLTCQGTDPLVNGVCVRTTQVTTVTRSGTTGTATRTTTVPVTSTYAPTQG